MPTLSTRLSSRRPTSLAVTLGSPACGRISAPISKSTKAGSATAIATIASTGILVRKSRRREKPVSKMYRSVPLATSSAPKIAPMTVPNTTEMMPMIETNEKNEEPPTIGCSTALRVCRNIKTAASTSTMATGTSTLARTRPRRASMRRRSARATAIMPDPPRARAIDSAPRANPRVVRVG